MADFLPADAVALLVWARNFTHRVGPAPAEYGLAAEEIDPLQQAFAEYERTLKLALAPETRTKARILNKQAARKQLVRVLRRCARLVRANPAVTPGQLTDLKLTLAPGRNRARIAAPSTPPLVHVASATPLRHELRLGPGAEVDKPRRGKPANVIGLQLFCHVGSAAPADPQDARFECFLTRSRYIREFKTQQVGQTAFYYARWQNATGGTGPWSQVARMTIAG